MKRVQRADGSLAQVWGRAAPNGLPAENITKPMRSRKNALCRAADSVLCVPSSPRRDRHQKMRNPEMNHPSPITARQLENALMAISTHGGIETYPFASRPVWRVRQTAGVNERKTLRQRRKAKRERTQNTRAETQGLPIRTHDSRKTNADARINLSGGRTEPLPALQKYSRWGRKF